ncbi:hypothetical protein D3C87_410950 [compost metagenome]
MKPLQFGAASFILHLTYQIKKSPLNKVAGMRLTLIYKYHSGLDFNVLTLTFSSDNVGPSNHY